jgi:phosphatidylglycerol:prolipoprotein diacylglycerol transferase
MRQVLFHIPGLNLPVFGFGAMLLLAFFSATWLLGRYARREGMDPNRVQDLALWIFLWGVIGARVFYMVQNPEEFDSLWAFFKIWNGGIVFYGAVVAAIVVFLYYTRVHQLPPWRVLDALAPASALGIGFGRIGCLLNGCCWGKRTDGWWGIRFPKDSIPWRHQVEQGWLEPGATASLTVQPTQIYLALAGFALMALLMWYYPRRRREGQVMVLLMVGYAVTRFALEYLRDDVPPLADGLTVSQNISVALLVAGIGLGVYVSRRPVQKPVEPAACPTP